MIGKNRRFGWPLFERKKPMQQDAKIVIQSHLFDHDLYARQANISSASRQDCVSHYLSSPQHFRLQPSKSFDGAAYLDHYPDVAADGANPLVHYLRYGAAEGRIIITVQEGEDLRFLLQTGFFDPDWYRKTQIAHLPESVDPSIHYLREGGRIGLQPGPLFDAKAYLELNQDLVSHAVNPLLHYLRSGRGEHRQAFVRKSAPTGAGASFQPIRLHNDPSLIGPIAVVVHAYYVELLEDLIPLLLNLPGKFDLFVSVKSDEDRALVDSRYRTIVEPRGTLQCRTFPNRGRNFGPMFAGFSREIVRYKYVLHLHTKRSLYTGEEQVGWRNSLYNGLVGSKALAEIVLSQFEQDGKIGVIAGPSSPHMPYWAHHWLANSHHGRSILSRLNLDPALAEGYIDYPVGGMFWARVDAIRPLLDLGMAFEDFDQEAGQTDGTLAHAIERLISIVPQAFGYDFIAFDRSDGSYWRNKTERNLKQYAERSIGAIDSLAERAKLISFDLFDTIVTRPTLHADAVLRFVGFKLSRLNPALNNYFDLRKDAENRARARREWAGDVSIHDIYQHFRIGGAWDAASIEHAKSLEWETDKKTLTIRPGARDLLSRLDGKRLIIISDTYYTSEYIVELLSSLGLGPVFSKLYLSCEVDARKDRGDIWRVVEEAEQISRAEWLHVGDNERSDIQTTCDLGIPSFHLMHPAHLLNNYGFAYHGRGNATSWASELIAGPAMQTLTGNPFPNGKLQQGLTLTNAHDVGYVVFGPIMFMFISWIVTHPAFALVDRALFLAREGKVLEEIYALFKNRTGDTTLPKGTYFYTSRRSSNLPALAVAFNASKVTTGAAFVGTFGDLLSSRIGVKIPDAYSPADWDITLPADEDDVTAAVDKLRNLIVSLGEKEKCEIGKYFENEGLNRNEMTAVVDVGYSSTIQSNLQTILDRPLVGFYMCLFDTGFQVESRGGFAFGCIEEGCKPWTSNEPVMRKSLLMEAFLTAPHGQVLRFEEGKPIFKDWLYDETQKQAIDALHRGALDYARDLFDIYGPDIAYVPVEKSVPQGFFDMLLNGHLKLPTDATKWFNVEDEYCGKPEISVEVSTSG